MATSTRDDTTYSEALLRLHAMEESLLDLWSRLSQAADKLVAILNPKTTRSKDFSDLALLKSMNLDKQVIASEVIWKLSTTFGDPDGVMAALLEKPESLTYDFVAAKAADFEKWFAKSGPARQKIDFVSTMQPVRQFYGSIRQIIGAARVRKVQGINPTVEDVKRPSGRLRLRLRKTRTSRWSRCRNTG